MSSRTLMMAPMHTSPSPHSRPQSAASSRDPPVSKGDLTKAPPKTEDVPASASHGERPYAPVLPPATDSHERETVEALIGLASTSRQSPATAALTTSFSAINVANKRNGHHDSHRGASSEHDHACNISCQAILSYEYPPNTAHPVGPPKDTRSKDGSSSRARRRRRSNSAGIESPRGHRKPYEGHILVKDTVMGDTAQPPRASSPQNNLQVSQKDAHSVPHKIESKQHHHSQRQRKHLPLQDQSVSPRSQQALLSRPQQPTVHYAHQKTEPRVPNTRPPRTYTANVDGLTVLRHTVSAECVQAAVNILDRGMKAIKTDPTFKVFDLPVEAFRVRDEFMGNVSVHYIPFLEVSLWFFELDLNFYAGQPTVLISPLCQTLHYPTSLSKASIPGPVMLSDTDMIQGLPRSPRLPSTFFRISQGSHNYRCIRISARRRSRPRQIFYPTDSKAGFGICNGGVDGFTLQQWSHHPPCWIPRG